MRNQPITAVIVGAGHRAFVYSKLALTDPDKLKIVGVADPDKIRQKKAMEMFGFPKENCFDSVKIVDYNGVTVRNDGPTVRTGDKVIINDKITKNINTSDS